MATKQASDRHPEGPPPRPLADGFLEFDLESGRLLAANDLYCTLSGFARSELLTMSLADLDRTLPGPEVVALYRAFAEQGPSRWLTSHLHKDGDSFPVEVTAVVSAAKGDATGRALIRDAASSEPTSRTARERNSVFRTLFHNNPVSTAIVRLSDSRFIEVNDAFLKLLGYERDEVVGADAAGFEPWVDPAVQNRLLEAIVGDGSIVGVEVPFRTKQGAVGTLLTIGQAIEVSGEPCALMFGVDITALKAAQLRAEVREAQLLSAIDNAPFGAHMYRLDPDDRLVLVGYNRKAEEMLGVDHSHLVGQTLEEAFTGNAGTETAVAYRRVAREGGTWETGEYAYDAQGIAGVFEIHAFATGEMKMTVFFRDITELRKLQIALREGEQRLSLALRAAELGVHEYEVATDTQLLDETACRILGLDPAKFADTPLHGTLEAMVDVHPDDRERLDEARALSLSSGTGYSFTYRVMWPDESVHWVHSHGDAITDDDGAITRVLGVVEDVTELETTRRTLLTTARTLKALSWANQALARSMDEPVLVADVCKVGVEQGGYRMVWVGYAQDDESKSVTSVAFAGHEEGFLSEVRFTWSDEDAEHNGPPGMAIRTGEPVVVRYMETDSRYREFAKAAMARGYASVAALPLLDAKQRAFGAIMFIRGRTGEFQSGEMDLLRELASDLAYGIEALRTKELRIRFEADLFASNERLQALLKDVVEAMSRVVEVRDPYTQGHQERVAGLAVAIAEELGMDVAEIDGIDVAAHLHDLGKLSVPAEILTKPTALTDIEFQLIKEHSQAGYDILKDIGFARPVAEMVLEHHERLDGSGYPRGLKGDEIMLEARILAVADVVEAMASHRPYRPALSLEAAMAEVSDASRFDPEVAGACVRLFESGRFSLEQ
jgi:PAS domain S-box-containing protein